MQISVELAWLMFFFGASHGVSPLNQDSGPFILGVRMEFLPSPSKNNMFSFGSEAQTSKHVKSSHRVIKTRDSLNAFSTKYHVTLIYRVIQSLGWLCYLHRSLNYGYLCRCFFYTACKHIHIGLYRCRTAKSYYDTPFMFSMVRLVMCFFFLLTSSDNLLSSTTIPIQSMYEWCKSMPMHFYNLQ